jgi:hypothetical protein
MGAAAARGAWSWSSCERRRVSGVSGVWWERLGTRHYWLFALVGVQSWARLSRATAADNTAVHAAVAMPRRPWFAVAASGYGSSRRALHKEDALNYTGHGRASVVEKMQDRRCWAVEWMGAGR